MKSNESEFVVVYGRRRVGKTFLINTFYKDTYAFKLTGLAKKSKTEQLANFRNALNRHCTSKKYNKPRTWYEAFEMLREMLDNQKYDGKRVIFIDELPWMDTRGGNLISALENFWNDWACAQNDIVLIICGSATSWITRKILKNRGGLHNRVTQKIYISPFSLHECKEYLNNRGIILDDKELAECYMIMGGIPFYLKNVRQGKSLSQNIDEMFFVENGSLANEFDALYSSLFDNYDVYIKIVEALSTKNKGLTREEIVNATKLKNNGHFSIVLQDLADCHFIRRYKGYGNKNKMSIYQLTDPFTLFYYKFIKDHGNTNKSFWQFQIGTQTHNVWAGLAFEQLCLSHYNAIERALGISGIITEVFSWTTPPNAAEKAQIDLIIKRNDKVINICEIKFYNDIYTMKQKDYNDIQRRVRIFKETNNIHTAVLPVLITTYGLADNQYSGFFQNVVTLKDLFKQ